MGEIVQFIPRKDIEAAKNLEAFVDMCRNHLKVFGNKLDFDANTWEIGEYLRIKGRENMHVNLQFANFDSCRKSKKWSPMQEPFLSFSKSYLRYMHGLRPTKAIANRMLALRTLERALSEHGQQPTIQNATVETFNRAGTLTKEKYKASAYRIGNELEQLAQFCTNNVLTSMQVQWKSYIKRPTDRNRIDVEAENNRKNKLPSKSALESLPKAFHLATETPDIIITSAAAILCSNPCRVNELLALPVDCEVEQNLNGKKAYGLRWWASKGGDPMIKWVIPSMVDVVKKAIHNIRQRTDEARRIAQWYEMNPEQLYMPKDLLHLRSQNIITCRQAAEIFGTNEMSVREWCASHNIQIINNHYILAEIEKVAVSKLPRNFPMFDSNTGLKFSKALFVVRCNEMNQQKSAYYFMFEPITISHINDGIGAGVKHGRSSVFSRMGFTEDDGSPIKMTSHQFRHWLNTMAQRGGMSQLDIAKWSGRINIHQNKDYDHMSSEELLLKLRNIAGDDVNVAQLPIEIRERNPVTRNEFINMMIPAAHTTELGFCIHDWTFLPCQLHQDCIHCSEHCYIKGDKKRMARIRNLLIETMQLLDCAEKAVDAEYAGADRWLEHQRDTVNRLRNLVAIFDDQDCPDGSLIRLSTSEHPSQIRFAMEEYNKKLKESHGMLATAEAK